jgi:hypothetical protein
MMVAMMAGAPGLRMSPSAPEAERLESARIMARPP